MGRARPLSRVSRRQGRRSRSSGSREAEGRAQAELRWQPTSRARWQARAKGSAGGSPEFGRPRVACGELGRGARRNGQRGGDGGWAAWSSQQRLGRSYHGGHMREEM
jgi:hypothetical protein